MLRLPIFHHLRPLAFAIFSCIIFSLGASGCHTLQPTPALEIGQIYHVEEQQEISIEDLVPHLLNADVIFLGEEHYTPSHLEAAETVLNKLLAHQLQPALAMEMFSWDGQVGLDHYIQNPDSSLEQVIGESNWSENWGGEFANYQPLVTFTKSHQLELLALNPPHALVRLVATQGLTKAMADPEMAKWPIANLVTDDDEYENLIFKQITACHAGLSDQVYRRIFEASIFRDEGMAQVIGKYLQNKSPSEGPLVSYTGGGHIQYRIPVPKRVQRTHPDTNILTIYLVAWDPSREDEVLDELKNGIADFLWLTPLGPNGIQAKC